MIRHAIHIEGAMEVLLRTTGVYEARIRLAGSHIVWIGTGDTPRSAIHDALEGEVS